MLSLEKGAAQNAIKEVFQGRNMDQQLLTARQLQAESERNFAKFYFPERVKQSFLPHMIELAERNNIKLMFVRVKRRRDAENKPQPQPLQQYAKDLKQYLNQNNIPLFDFSYDKRLTLEYFGAGDHMSKPVGQQFFTRLLVEEMKKYFKD